MRRGTRWHATLIALIAAAAAAPSVRIARPAPNAVLYGHEDTQLAARNSRTVGLEVHYYDIPDGDFENNWTLWLRVDRGEAFRHGQRGMTARRQHCLIL